MREKPGIVCLVDRPGWQSGHNAFYSGLKWAGPLDLLVVGAGGAASRTLVSGPVSLGQIRVP